MTRPAWYDQLEPMPRRRGQPSRRAQMAESGRFFRPPHETVPARPEAALPASFRDGLGNAREVADLDDLARLTAAGQVAVGQPAPTDSGPPEAGIEGTEGSMLYPTAPSPALQALILALLDVPSRNAVLENDAYARGYDLAVQGSGPRPVGLTGAVGIAYARGIQDGALERFGVPQRPPPRL